MGGLGHADVIILVIPSLSASNQMLSIYKVFAAEIYVIFNARKTKCIKFDSHVKCDDVVYLDGTLLQCVDQVNHLGNMVNVSLTDNSD